MVIQRKIGGQMHTQNTTMKKYLCPFLQIKNFPPDNLISSLVHLHLSLASKSYNSGPPPCQTKVMPITLVPDMTRSMWPFFLVLTQSSFCLHVSWYQRGIDISLDMHLQAGSLEFKAPIMPKQQEHAATHLVQNDERRGDFGNMRCIDDLCFGPTIALLDYFSYQQEYAICWCLYDGCSKWWWVPPSKYQSTCFCRSE